MRVFQLTQRFSPALGGVEAHVLHLANWLVRAGVSTEVFTTDLQRDTPFRRLDRRNDSTAVPIQRHRAIKFLDVPHGLGIAAPSMLTAVMAGHPDLVHAHSYGYFPTFVAGLTEMVERVPLVVTTHCDTGGRSLGKRLFDIAVPALTIRRAHRIIALTRSEAVYLAHLGIPEQRIRVIPNGVDLAEFTMSANSPKN